MYERDGRTDGHHMTAKAALDVSIARQKLLLILTSRHVFKSLDFYQNINDEDIGIFSRERTECWSRELGFSVQNFTFLSDRPFLHDKLL